MICFNIVSYLVVLGLKKVGHLIACPIYFNLIRNRSESFYFDKELLKLSKTLTSQSLLKHILTEGDKMMMAKFADATAQGVYAFVVNYGEFDT